MSKVSFLSGKQYLVVYNIHENYLSNLSIFHLDRNLFWSFLSFTQTTPASLPSNRM